MDEDKFEAERRRLTGKINSEAEGLDPETYRLTLAVQHGPVWDTEELTRDFEVVGFLAPCVLVKRKSDGKRGTLFFSHRPRFYFSFQEG